MSRMANEGPALAGDYEHDADAAGAYFERPADDLASLPPKPQRDEREQAQASEILVALDATRDRFLTRHTRALYSDLTKNGTDGLRADDLVYAAAERVPGLAPTRAAIEREREHLQKDKDGHEIAQGLLLGHVLSHPETGRHLIDVMLRPTALALEHREAFEASGSVDLGTAAVSRDGNVGTVELR